MLSVHTSVLISYHSWCELAGTLSFNIRVCTGQCMCVLGGACVYWVVHVYIGV